METRPKDAIIRIFNIPPPFGSAVPSMKIISHFKKVLGAVVLVVSTVSTATFAENLSDLGLAVAYPRELVQGMRVVSR